MRAAVRLLASTSSCLLLAANALAQASITGTARDASGGVLPGVTVEAASAALIEKQRIATTDGSGQYRIVNLPPGEYSLSFSLRGFNRVVRAGVEVSGSGVITIPAEMALGNLQEQIVVTFRGVGVHRLWPSKYGHLR